MTSTAEEDAVDNAYATINRGLEDETSLKNVELKDMSESKTEEANGMHPGKVEQSNHMSSSKTDSGAPSSGSKPFLPKIFIALLIVLLIAVIALCFVLYHLDQEVDKANSQTATVQQKIKAAEKASRDLELKIKTLKAETEKLDVEKKLAIRDKKIEDVTFFADQLKMFVQMDDERFKPLKLKFKDILKFANITDKVTPADPLLAQLRKQYDDFHSIYETKWDITYDDVLRLMDESNFKKGVKELPLLRKIDALCKLFEKDYEKKWGIAFKDVIRLAKSTDLPTVPTFNLIGGGSAFASTPLVLRKIDHLYDIFKKNYNDKWHIKFPDVIKVTTDVSFAEDATDIPALKKIDEYYVVGFQDIWGDTFEEFLHLVLAMEEKEGKDLVEKMKGLTKDVKLKFLPAKFEYKEKRLTLSGYVQIKMEKRWGTIFNNEGKFADKEASMVCNYSGYSNGRYEKSKGGSDRSSLPYLVKLLRCFPDAKVVSDCQLKLVQQSLGVFYDNAVSTSKPKTEPTKIPKVSSAAPTEATAKTTSKVITEAPTKVPSKGPPATKATVPTSAPITTAPPTTAPPTEPPTTAPPPWDHKDDVSLLCVL